jgi:hypothetical protein
LFKIVAKQLDGPKPEQNRHIVKLAMIAADQYGNRIQEKEDARQPSGPLAQEKINAQISQAKHCGNQITQYLVVVCGQQIQAVENDEPHRTIIVAHRFRIDIAAVPGDFGHGEPGAHVKIVAERGDGQPGSQSECHHHHQNATGL